MKFTIIRSKFLDGLKAVQSVVASKGSLPVLQNVLLEANGKELKMTTTDLDISTTSIVECKVEDHGASTLPMRLLLNAVSKAAEGEIQVEVDANGAVMRELSYKAPVGGNHVMLTLDIELQQILEESLRYNIEEANKIQLEALKSASDSQLEKYQQYSPRAGLI